MPNRKPKIENNDELPRKVGIIYSDVRREYFPTEAQYITEKDAAKDAGVIGRYLESLGIAVLLYPGNADLPSVSWPGQTRDSDKPGRFNKRR